MLGLGLDAKLGFGVRCASHLSFEPSWCLRVTSEYFPFCTFRYLSRYFPILAENTEFRKLSRYFPVSSGYFPNTLNSGHPMCMHRSILLDTTRIFLCMCLRYTGIEATFYAFSDACIAVMDAITSSRHHGCRHSAML